MILAKWTKMYESKWSNVDRIGVSSSSCAGGVLGNRLAVAFEMGVRNSIVILGTFTTLKKEINC